ncbi:DinB family protein [Aquimarina sp. 2-A2]|uniref:DinB family protein n=1 Tax=Aquimarina sp. 2-A2 TaxID=3382644 RepID=UPI00387F0C3E
MKIDDIHEFIDYYIKIKKRTQRLFDYIPDDKLEWTYREGAFTIGDQIRHLANIERFMYAETVQRKKSKYAVCGITYATGLSNVIDYYNRKRFESLQIFESLSNEDLFKKCTTPANIDITIWKWLRAMVEHEVHHRAQLYMYLSLLEIKTPPLFGLSSEEVSMKSEK